jgi:Cu+-exporting ATPase
MKKSIFLLGIVALLSVACNQEPKQLEIPTASESKEVESKDILAENKVEVNMEVEGMTCAMGCAKFIEEKVGGLSGVVLSQVNFKEKTAHFTFDKTQTSTEEIEEYINNIHDGIYKAKAVSKEDSSSDQLKNSESEEESLSSVRESLNISFPELFTYFIKRIR